MINKELKKAILGFQKSEITEHNIYSILAKRAKGKNSEVLERISKDELRHYNKWKKYTGKDVRPSKYGVWKFLFISRIFGLTFAMKMMEGGEEGAQEIYSRIKKDIPETGKIISDETEHEKLLVNMIDEEKIGYIGSMVLGLNDALVELTGALAGLSFALQNTLLVAVAGLITGISASLSMAASEYLSQKSEGNGKSPLKASFYTGIAYVLTVLLLISPFFIFPVYYISLGVTILMAVLVILFFTFFTSVVKEISFKKMFTEMLVISLGVAGISFVIGVLVRVFLGIEI